MRRKHVTRLHNGEEDTSSDDNTTMDHEEEAFAAIQTEKPVSILTNYLTVIQYRLIVVMILT
jgi:hypothetical protein